MRFKLVTLGALAYVGLKQHKNFEQHVETRSFWNFFGGSDKTKSVSIPNEDLPKPPLRSIKDKFVVYQYATCPFCNKLTAYLDYYGIPYQKVEVQPIPKTQLKWFKGEKKKVPTLRIFSESGESLETVLQDSSLIISLLHSYQFDKEDSHDWKSLDEHYKEIIKSANDTNVAKYTIVGYGLDDMDKAKNEQDWRIWADQKLVHMIAPNVYRTFSEALDSFKIITAKGNFGSDHWWGAFYKVCAEFFGATFMVNLSKRLKKKYGLDENVRHSLYVAVNDWLKELDGAKFHGGDSPDLADLAVYGTLKSMEDMEAFLDMLQYTKIGPWYGRMQKLCEKNSRMIRGDKKESSE